MSLQTRLILAILGALGAMLLLGGLATVLHVRERIEAEMRSAHIVAEHRVARQIAELPATMDHEAKFRALIRTFDSDRHARLSLIGRDGRMIMRSHLDGPRHPAPAWFAALFAPGPEVSVIPLPVSGPVAALELTVDPASHTRDVWTDLGLGLTLLGLFVVTALALVWVIARTSLKPLDGLRHTLRAIGEGRTDERAALAGPPEIRALAQSCNDMAARLSAMSADNRRLSELVYRMQEEERAELARDLHDEVGPFLFAIDVDAAAIEREPAGTANEERAGAIRQATARARQAVRRILADLRPGLLPGLGLRETLVHLAHDFESRRPGIRIKIAVPEAGFDAQTDATLLMVLREAMLNALRHGEPSRLDVSVRAIAGGAEFSVVDDGGGRHAGADGFGIIGMRERVEAAGGKLRIVPVDAPAGLRVEGRLPIAVDSPLDGPGDSLEAAA